MYLHIQIIAISNLKWKKRFWNICEKICNMSGKCWPLEQWENMLENYFEKYGHSIIAWYAIALFSNAFQCITVICTSTYLKEFLKYIEMWFEF